MTRGSRRRWTLGSGGWTLPGLLLIAVVVPSACVLWFMNEAVENQAAATRQAVAEAYRGQLRLVRDRLISVWQSRVEALKTEPSANAAVEFSRLVTSGAADAVVMLSQDGSPTYPKLPRADGLDPDGLDSDAVRVAQRVVSDLLAVGNTRAAIEAIPRLFGSGAASRATDRQGRLIAANQRLLLITLLPPGGRREAEMRQLIQMVNDYTAPLPSAQRVFLMQQLGALDPKISFPTLEAERLALAFLERDRPAPANASLRPTALPEVWQMPSSAGRAVALYRTATIAAVMEKALTGQTSAGVSFRVIPPGQPTHNDAIAIGSLLPGWEVAFTANADTFDADQARGRRNAYLAVAAIAIVLIVAAAFTIGSAARRQARLAALKTDLVSAVSHELKTPLASMRLLVDALLEDDELEPAKTRDYLKLMAVENARLTRLIDNFLTFSRPERNRQQFAFKPASAADIVDDALNALPEDRRRQHAAHVDVATDIPAIVADHDAMVTVLLNLLDNAYKYTPADKQISLRVFHERGTDQVVFAVADNGIGIPVRDHKRIFRRFYRVDQRLARETTGSGLGLSIVEAIVRAHGGTVQVESVPERGSTFTVSVPCVAEGTVA